MDQVVFSCVGRLLARDGVDPPSESLDGDAYPFNRIEEICTQIVAEMERCGGLVREQRRGFSPSEDVLAVTGADIFLAGSGETLRGPDMHPLEYLYRFLDEPCEDLFSGLYLVPFPPENNPYGDPAVIAREFRLMTDLGLDECLRDPASMLVGTVTTLLEHLTRGVHLLRPVLGHAEYERTHREALLSLIHYVATSVDPSALIVTEFRPEEPGSYLYTTHDVPLLLLDALLRSSTDRLRFRLESLSAEFADGSCFNYCPPLMELEESRIARLLGEPNGAGFIETVIRRGGTPSFDYLNVLVDPNLPSVQRVPISLVVHAVILAQAGVPCLNLAGLLGLDGDTAGLSYEEVIRGTESEETVMGGLFAGILDLVRARSGEAAFDPQAEQRLPECDHRLLAILRTPRAGTGAEGSTGPPPVPVICLHNFSSDFVLFRDRRDRYPWPQDGVFRDLVSGDLVIPTAEGALFSLELAPWEVLWLRFGSSLDETGDRLELVSAAYPGQLEEN